MSVIYFLGGILFIWMGIKTLEQQKSADTKLSDLTLHDVSGYLFVILYLAAGTILVGKAL